MLLIPLATCLPGVCIVTVHAEHIPCYATSIFPDTLRCSLKLFVTPQLHAAVSHLTHQDKPLLEKKKYVDRKKKIAVGTFGGSTFLRNRSGLAESTRVRLAPLLSKYSELPLVLTV